MGWVLNAKTRPLYPREIPGTHCIGGWVGPRASLDGCGQISSPQGFDPQTVQPVASTFCKQIQFVPHTEHVNYWKHLLVNNVQGKYDRENTNILSQQLAEFLNDMEGGGIEGYIQSSHDFTGVQIPACSSVRPSVRM